MGHDGLQGWPQNQWRASMTNAQEAVGGREAVAVFDTAQPLQNAIDELLSSEFDRAELSLLASEAEVSCPSLVTSIANPVSWKTTLLCQGPLTFHESDR
jgi:hypothetical protein